MPEPTRKELDKQAKKAGVPNPEDLPNKEAVAERIEHNPALVPPPEPEPEPEVAAPPPPEPGPDEKVYTVNGVTEVLGHKPGETFVARIPAEQEALLLGAGHLIYAKE